jgi:2-iminobutanoate/2-iminopropanoate deaminase
MNSQQINPWTWQDQFGFSQAWRVDDAQSIVFVSGQGPVSPDGELVGEGDFEAQTRQVFENLQTVLSAAGASFDAIMKITVYLTDIGTLRDFGRIKAEFIPGEQPASTALEVSSLALPGMMIEVEAIAVRG